ncbi:MAG TPA: bifunctional 23S rRNA (guanine(2069)-N(7))-methyltransferase RlmK/23S rRNA (guanine(2445)-N(2))-methyltransferase RlmL, partial [Steroidobacteraceae bacterium]|nr:bifunctional 23S rRNA (guanine(2069)-N(7))-methyltransferase RlmK/23S rRNA (guanine(2445)-N(2))-methyltransferase RlmL [Steroidobacteraceae bacterium]
VQLQFFAACPRNVADLLAGELRPLGIDVQREHPAGVSFRGPLEAGYAACLHSRTASRVLLSLGEFGAGTPDDLYQGMRALCWEEHLRGEGSIAIDVVGQPPGWLRHTRFAAMKAKDAIVDRFREREGLRPSVNLTSPDLRISLRFARERVEVGIDLCGEPLHRRGYRQSGVEAPLKENLAAALLLRAGWPGIASAGGAFADPMCGSGTLVIEAALIAAQIAPGLLRRKFAFERWLQHDAAAWQQLREQAVAARRLESLEPGRLRGYDRDLPAVRAALANSNRAGLGDQLVFARRELAGLEPAREATGLVLVNPPYGARLGEEETLAPVYAQLGQTLMRCFPAWEAAVFTGSPQLGRSLGLRAYRTHTFFNGPIECRLLRLRLDASAVEPDRETARAERLERARLRPGAAMFANRLRKNLKRLSRWAAREDVCCYRVYDADMPEYAFAIDVYGNEARHAYVQEYEAPATIARDAVRARRDEALSVLPEVLGIAPGRVHLRTRRRQKAGAQYEKLEASGEFHEVREGRYRFLVNFTDYLDTGLFLDHRLTRRFVGEQARGRSFLNLFAYTGTATVYAAGGGATSSTTVDMSRTYIDWAERNLALNGLAGPGHGFVREDCLRWLDEQAGAPGRRYGLIFVDPPTHSRSKRMEKDFDVQRDHVGLLRQAASLLEPDGMIVFSNNSQRFRLDHEALSDFQVEDLSRATLPVDFERNARIHVCYLLRRSR